MLTLLIYINYIKENKERNNTLISIYLIESILCALNKIKFTYDVTYYSKPSEKMENIL
jgi:hypothetical protein